MELLDIGYCDLDKDLDHIISLYEQLNQKIAYLLYNEPYHLSNILWDHKKSSLIDNDCKCNIIFNNSNYLANELYKCKHCIIFDRLLFMNYNNTIDIEYGKYKNKKLKIINSGHVEPMVNINQNYIKADTFTNNYLGNIYINELLKEEFQQNYNNNIPGLINNITSFICGHNGYNLIQYPDINSLSNYIDKNNSFDNIYNLLLQLFSIMHVLKKYNVSIFEISNETFNFMNTPINYIYDGINIKDNITLKLNLDKIAININNRRMYPMNNLLKLLTTNTKINKIIYNYNICNFDVCNKEVRNLYYLDDNEKNYYISNKNLTYYRYMGYIEESSFEAYLFIIFLITNKKIYDLFMSNEKLYNLWTGLWINNENNDILKEIEMIHKNPELKIESILMTYKLRTDAVDYIWNYLKNI